MHRLILLLGLFLCFPASSFSQCEVSTYIEDNFTQYGKFLALREIQANPADPDYDNPIVPISRITPYLEKLSAIYENPNSDPIIDLLFGDFSINVNPEYNFLTPYNVMSLVVDNAAPWVDDFINTGVSGNAALDDLISTYDFYLESHIITGVTRLRLQSNMDALNTPSLEDEFLAVDFVTSSFADINLDDRLNYDGIVYTINGDPALVSDIYIENNSYTFCLYSGDCFAGCLYAECWVVEVSEDCSIVTVLDTPNASIANFTVYPNPALDIIHIQGVTSQIKNTLIYSVTGQLILPAPLNSETINISNLPSGIYFLEIITSEGDKQIQKFIKH